MLTSLAETCHTDWELRGLCLAERCEEARDAGHGDAEAGVEDERPEAKDCASDIRPGVDPQAGLGRIVRYALQILDVAHEPLGPQSGVERLDYP